MLRRLMFLRLTWLLDDLRCHPRYRPSDSSQTLFQWRCAQPYVIQKRRGDLLSEYIQYFKSLRRFLFFCLLTWQLFRAPEVSKLRYPCISHQHIGPLDVPVMEADEGSEENKFVIIHWSYWRWYFADLVDWFECHIVPVYDSLLMQVVHSR